MSAEVQDSSELVELVQHACAGNLGAFDAIVDRYWDRIRRWLFVLTCNRTSAEDLAQETFLRVWQQLSTLSDAKLFQPWLFRIAHNLALDYRKRERLRRTETIPDGISNERDDPLIAAMENEGRTAYQAAVAHLAHNYQIAYLLWTQQDMPYAEMAVVLDITEELARWRVSEARRRLLVALKPYLDVVT